jgi:hypothetical protein
MLSGRVPARASERAGTPSGGVPAEWLTLADATIEAIEAD